MCTCKQCDKPVFKNGLCKFHVCFKQDNASSNKENTMELIVPKSLLIAMNHESIVELSVEDIKNNLAKAIQLISKYEAQHNYVPTEWSMFLDNINNLLSQVTVKEGEAMNVIELETKRTEWITKLVFEEIGYSEKDLRALSMVELRDLYEDTFPSYITVRSATSTGGVKKLVTKISKPA